MYHPSLSAIPGHCGTVQGTSAIPLHFVFCAPEGETDQQGEADTSKHERTQKSEQAQVLLSPFTQSTHFQLDDQRQKSSEICLKIIILNTLG